MNISDLPQEISILREERLKAENRLMRAKEMFPCSLILRKVICGNPNCARQEGKLHGPYPFKLLFFLPFFYQKLLILVLFSLNSQNHRLLSIFRKIRGP